MKVLKMHPISSSAYTDVKVVRSQYMAAHELATPGARAAIMTLTYLKVIADKRCIKMIYGYIC